MADPIFDAGNHEALRTRTFVDESGILRSERRPRGRLIMMIDSAGNEIAFRMTNAISENNKRDPYGLELLSFKTAPNAKWKTEGMIPSRTCPQQTEYEFRLPQHLKTGKRCERAADGQAIGEDSSGAPHLCVCISKLQAERQARQADLEKKRDPETEIRKAMKDGALETNAKLTELLGQLMAPKVAAEGAGDKAKK